MIVRIDDLVLAFRVPGKFERDVGQDFVGVHVGRSSGAALVPIDDKLVVVFAVEHGLAGLFDRGQRLRLHGAHFRVGPRCRQFDDRPGFHEARIVIDRHARNLEILERAGGLNAVVGIAGTALSPSRSCSTRVAPLGCACRAVSERARASEAPAEWRLATNRSTTSRRAQEPRWRCGAFCGHSELSWHTLRSVEAIVQVVYLSRGPLERARKLETMRSPSGTRRSNSGVPWGTRRSGVKG